MHWLHALHTANQPEVRAAAWSARVLEMAGRGLVVAPLDPPLTMLPRNAGMKIAGRRRVAAQLREDSLAPDGPVMFQHHDPERLAHSLQVGGTVLVNDQYAIMRVGSYCFSVTTEALGPCPSDAPPAGASAAQLAERLRTHGGFSVPLHGAEGEPA